MSIGIDYGPGMISSTDAEIEKDNRLCDLKKIHRQWLGKKEQKEKQQTEAVMSKKIGDCEQCGKEGVSIKMSYGKSCCATCTSLRSGIKNNPDVVRASLTEFHGTVESTHVKEKYDELQEQNQSLADSNNELVESTGIWESFYKGLMAIVLPAVDPAAVDFYEYRDSLQGVVQAKLELAQEEPDASGAIEKVSTLLGLEGASLARVVETVEAHMSSMKYYQEQSGRMRDALEDRERQITELTKIVTASNPKEERRDHVLDLALALIREEGSVADKLELLRHGVA
jgi:hypothetical protein